MTADAFVTLHVEVHNLVIPYADWRLYWHVYQPG